MKFTIKQSLLTDTISIANKAVATRPHHPILINLLLVSDSATQQLTIIGFNLNLGIRINCDCQVETDGTVALPAKLLTEVVSHLAQGDVCVEVENSIVTLTHKTGSCRLQGVNSEEFPLLPEPQGTTIVLPVAQLQNAISKTLFAAAHEETKKVLAGVHLKLSSSDWEAAATDGHRLAVASGTIKSDSTEEIPETEVTIPYSSCIEIEKILTTVQDGSTCTINVGDGIVIFDLPNLCVTSRLLEGEYPKYPSLIPSQFDYQFTADKKALEAAIKRVATVADHKNRIIKVAFSKERATIHAECTDVGGAVEALAIESETNCQEQLDIGFNIRYLIDALKSISTSKVLIKANQPIHPVIITPVDSTTNQLILVMPMQIFDSTFQSYVSS